MPPAEVMPTDCRKSARFLRAPIHAPTDLAWRFINNTVRAAQEAEVRTQRRKVPRQGHALTAFRAASMMLLGNTLLAWGRPTPAVSLLWLDVPVSRADIDPRIALTTALEALEAADFVRVSRGFAADDGSSVRGAVIVPTERLLDCASATGICPQTVAVHFDQPDAARLRLN
jgi:hypothetical protein